VLTAWIAQHRLAGDDVHPLLDPVVKVVGAARAVGTIFEHAGATTTVWVVAGWTLLLAIAATTSPPLSHAPNAP
jgi:hypothetical protein